MSADGKRGMVGQSRKIKAFLWMTAAIIALVAMTTRIGTPENVSIQALWAVAAGGLFTVGGQSLVDVFAMKAKKNE